MGKLRAWLSAFAACGGGWVLGQAVLTTAVLVLGVAWHGQPSILLRVAGVLLLVIAALVGLAGLAAQGRRLTPFPKPREDAQLIQGGIYGWIRHPLYTCNLCGFFGWALLWSSLAALVAAVAAVPFFVAKARREERWLREKFPGYADYERRVKRFVPGLF
jgi:protein-S-isoprenylcysteine O-methyltransferase Ste14